MPTTLAAYIQGALLRGAARGREAGAACGCPCPCRRRLGHALHGKAVVLVVVLDLVDTAVHHVAAVGGGDHRGGRGEQGGWCRPCPAQSRATEKMSRSVPSKFRLPLLPRQGNAPGAPGGHTRRAGCPAASVCSRRSGWKAATSVPTTRSEAGRPRSSRSFTIAATSPLQSPPDASHLSPRCTWRGWSRWCRSRRCRRFSPTVSLSDVGDDGAAVVNHGLDGHPLLAALNAAVQVGEVLHLERPGALGGGAASIQGLPEAALLQVIQGQQTGRSGEGRLELVDLVAAASHGDVAGTAHNERSHSPVRGRGTPPAPCWR